MLGLSTRKSSQRVVPQRPDSSLTIEVNGHLIDSFRGRELGDNVLRSMRFLADILPKHGLALTAGQFILTGSLMQLIPIRPPSHILVNAGPWGAVEAEIGA